ncbi:hypothetical protein BJY04DRAFT_204681 [Aspergillus karnatakaensis]|uniref:FG-nucleoporin NUP159 n=1 Tax=Aspergillus karnatakaensis TaxID=1810916 RepID=UPI003CCCED12
MAFSMGTANPAGAELGPELPDLYADEVGFKGVSGDSNIQFLPTPWPVDALPAPTCTLLAVAATKGIAVGAAPNALSVASTEAIRAAISADTGKDKVKTKPFQPQATIPLPGRPTHIAFASGDSALVLATENGSQLSVFETASLLQPNPQPAISIPTNGATFRAIAPNPAQADDSHTSLVALVTNNGELLIADLKAGNLITGTNGNILKTGVSSVCWSNKGKQLVAGLADGSGFQMTPEGIQKDIIPSPSDLSEPCHVSSVAWLENDIFLMVYTPNAVEDDMGMTPSSSYYIITRRKQSPFLIQKLPELATPFGYKRAPAYQFIQRLRGYKPHLNDALIVSSTASADVGLITRSDEPLANDDAAKAAVKQFATTEVNDDSKKASVPLKDSVDETSVIGLAIDLSSSEVVISPIPGEDITESSTPLPNLFLLNHEGILCSWWFIYSESIRQNIPYPGLTSVLSQQPTLSAQPPQPQPPAQPAFGQSGFGSSASPAQPKFGASSFGTPTAAPAFGSTSALGGASQQPAFGKPAFGTPTFGAPSFGAPAALGSGTQSGTSVFGQPSTPGKGFGSLLSGAGGASTGGGFGSFANTSSGGGFASLATSKPAGGSSFGQPSESSPFGKPSVPSAFGNQPGSSAFGSQSTEEPKGAFGSGSSGFVLGSTFKGDGTAVNDAPKPDKPSGVFSFGSSFDDMVATPSKTSPPTETMDDMEDSAVPRQDVPEKKELAPSLFGAPSKAATKPQDISAKKEPAPSLFGAFGSQTLPENKQVMPSLFGAPSKPASGSQDVEEKKEGTSSPFGAPSKPAAPSSIFGSFGSQAQTHQPFGSAQTSKSPFSFANAGAADNQVASPPSAASEKTAMASPPLTQVKLPEPEAVAEMPLPPDSTSKTVYGPGDTSASSNVSKSSVEDAPLPPDCTAQRESREPEREEERPLVVEEAPLPPDFTKSNASFPKEPPPIPDGSDADESEKDSHDEESDFEDSGEDVSHERSQPETESPDVQSSPEGSLDSKHSEDGPAGSLFNRIAQPKQPSRQLFGEISKPFFPQTTQAREPPRSPSPVRPTRTQKGLPKLDNLRSVSAPHKPGSALAARKASLSELAKRESVLKPQPTTTRKSRPQRDIQTQEEALSDDEDERLRADLSRPLEPVPTLDPFLPHQDYTGQTTKPGIPGQIERLYRDINSMVDTLGINARSLSSFLLYQRESSDSDWVSILKGDDPADILDEKLLLGQIEDLDDAVAALAESLENQRVQGVDEKLESCRELLSKDILTLRSQCANIRKTLDAYTDAAAIISAPLSAEQANLQQSLRTSSTGIQSRLADLESAVSLLRARIAETPRSDGSRQSTRRPTVEAVTSTISTMMNMAESKSGDIDVLEAQLKKLGFDTSATPIDREGSPFTTPRKGLGKIPITPGSHGSTDGPISSYHTPDSTARSLNFRSSINGSAKASRLRSMETVGDLSGKREVRQLRAKLQRKQQIVGSLKKAIDGKQSKVRSVDEL